MSPVTTASAAPTSTHAISIRGLRKSFGPVEVLKNIDLDIEPGQVVCVIGPSGSGKSTLLRCVNMLETPTAGKVFIGNDEMTDPDVDLDKVRRRVGMVFQNFNLFPHLTVLKNLTVAQMQVLKRDRAEAEKIARENLERVGMAHKESAFPAQLSGGQQQRIAIARLFLKDPPIIFLDEPTASLDAIATEQIKNSLDAIKQGRTVVIISHSLAQIVDSDCIYVMKKGEAVESGTHHELYEKRGTYREIFDASARSLNIEKLAKTMADDGDEVLDTAL